MGSSCPSTSSHAPTSATVATTGRSCPGRARTRWPALAVFALLSLYATLAWTATLNKGQSFDEGLQLAVGYNLWLNDDYRMEGANGDLVKRWATLPYLFTRPRFVSEEDRYWQASASYEIAHRFFFQLGNIPEALLWQGRAMVAWLGMATGLLIFGWARSLFGTVGGLIALTIFTFSPNMLAFGGIVSTDMSITLTLFAATWCIWRLLHEITLARALASLVALGLLVLAKPTALIVLPITAILIAVKLGVGKPLNLRWRSRRWTLQRRRTQLAAIAGAIVLHAFAGWTAIWAHYGFRYEASPDPADPALRFSRLSYRDGIATPLKVSLHWIHETRILPEGFHRGVNSLAGNDDETVSFLNGKWTTGGRPEFFPYTLWVKTPPALLVLLLVGAVALWRARLQGGPEPATPRRNALGYEIIPLVTLLGCYLAVAVTEDLNIGHRHVLPMYPALYVLAGAGGLAFAAGRRWLPVTCIAGALAWTVAESISIRPNYIAYFGPQAGGPNRGYQHLVDSSLDWGMSLPSLKRWFDAHDPDHKTLRFLAYFGTDSPSYQGVKARRLPGFYDRRPIQGYPYQPGYYAISATLFQGLYTLAHGPWRKGYEEAYRQTEDHMQQLETEFMKSPKIGAGPAAPAWMETIAIYDSLRFARLCAWLRHNRAPDHQVDHSILIWKLSLEDLTAALRGPPAELTDDPVPKRAYGRHRPVKD
ncbi:MAG: glycosyltransferase family 39 protein [Verrucomicrobiota bacterium]